MFSNCCLNVRNFSSTSNTPTSVASQVPKPPLSLSFPPSLPPQILLFQEDNVGDIQISIPRLDDNGCNENWEKVLAQHEHIPVTGTVNEDCKTDTFLEPVFYTEKKIS